MQLSFFADENISEELIEWLRQQKVEVSSIKEEKLFSISDKEIINKCFREKCIIITQDNDFGKIVFTEETSFYNNLFATWSFKRRFSHSFNTENSIPSRFY
jgi:predicted nuclease of predicted toxin-antitoxin system